MIPFRGAVRRLLTDIRRHAPSGACPRPRSGTASQTMRGIGLALSLLFIGAAGAQADLTIMPLGGSITYGGAQGYNIVPGGYRTRLYTDLQNAGLSFTFVGTVTDNASTVLTQAGQIHHEGHPGYRINQIMSNLDGNDPSGPTPNNGGFWFHKPAPPDIVLLFTGGSEIMQNTPTATAADRLDALVGQIVGDSPSSLLFVSNVTPFTINTAAQNKLLDALNTQIRDVIVAKYVNLGANVIFVDQYANFVDANGHIIHVGSDGIHPDQTGYDLMGDTWAAAVLQTLSGHPVRYTPFDVSDALGTGASGINSSGQIVGGYHDVGSVHGFLLDQGSYTTLDMPGATYTEANGINDSGLIVGSYYDSAGYHGFLLEQGNYSSLDVPGSFSTSARGINASGQVVGYYADAAGTHGFLFDQASYVALDVPGFAYTQALGINDSGLIVGFYYDAAGGHGFLLQQGTYTTLDVPGASRTYGSGINDAGQIVGFYLDAAFTYHGFLLDQGSYTTLDAPGSGSTFAQGINASGQIVGSYSTGTAAHGFLARPVP
jgi:probable HAF family extracellular repeat protein